MINQKLILQFFKFNIRDWKIFLNNFKIELNLMENLNDNIENNFSLNDLEVLIIDEIKNVKY